MKVIKPIEEKLNNNAELETIDSQLTQQILRVHNRRREIESLQTDNDEYIHISVDLEKIYNI